MHGLLELPEASRADPRPCSLGADKLVDEAQIQAEVYPGEADPAETRYRVAADKGQIGPIFITISLPNVDEPEPASGNGAGIDRQNGKSAAARFRRDIAGRASRWSACAARATGTTGSTRSTGKTRAAGTRTTRETGTAGEAGAARCSGKARATGKAAGAKPGSTGSTGSAGAKTRPEAGSTRCSGGADQPAQYILNGILTIHDHLPSCAFV